MPSPPWERVVSVTAAQRVGSAGSGERVAAATAGQVLGVRDGVRACPDRVLRGRHGEVHRDRARCPRVAHGVGAVATVDGVVPGTTDQRVVGGITLQAVVPVATVDGVVPVATVDGVRDATSRQVVGNRSTVRFSKVEIVSVPPPPVFCAVAVARLTVSAAVTLA